MDFYRYVLLIVESEDKKRELLDGIPEWEYSEELESDLRSLGFSFVLINKKENIIIYFKKLKNCVYTSMNVLPYNVSGLTAISEPQEKDIHNDILFKLCMVIKKKFINLEVRCGIIPSENDET